MLKKILTIIIIIITIALIYVLDTNAQTNQSSNADNSSALNTQTTAVTSLNGQFQTLIEKSGNYQTFKVIQKEAIIGFWNQSMDTLKALRQKISSQKQKIYSINQELEEKNEIISKKEIEIEKNSGLIELIDVFGFTMTKSNYKTLSMIVITIILAILAYIFYLYRNSKTITNEAVAVKDDVEKLLSIEKKKRSDDIHRLKRELQTEINLVNELKEKLK